MADAWAWFADGTATWLLTYLVHSSVLILATWGLTRVARMQPATRDFLWKTALVGGLCTTTVASLGRPRPALFDYATSPLLHTTGLENVDDQMAGAFTWVGDSPETPVQIRARLVDPSAECTALLRSGLRQGPDALARADHVCGASGPINWWDAGVIIWLLGAGMAIAFFLRGRRSLGILTESLTEASPRSRAILAELRASAGLGRSVQVRGSHLLHAACVLPGDTIALSVQCERDLSEQELRAVIAHELAHVMRRDPTWSIVLRAISAFLWFQPLNRLGLAMLSEASEHLCDDWAVSRTGEAIGLASSISRVADWALPAAPLPPAMVSVAGRGRRGLAVRVRRILFDDAPTPEPRWLRHVWAMALLVPLYWIPVVRAPATLHASIVIEEGESRISDGSVERRVVLARFRQD